MLWLGHFQMHLSFEILSFKPLFKWKSAWNKSWRSQNCEQLSCSKVFHLRPWRRRKGEFTNWIFGTSKYLQKCHCYIASACCSIRRPSPFLDVRGHASAIAASVAPRSFATLLDVRSQFQLLLSFPELTTSWLPSRSRSRKWENDRRTQSSTLPKKSLTLLTCKASPGAYLLF